MRHGRRWSKWLVGTIVTIVVAALCIGAGIAASSALRSNDSHTGSTASNNNGRAAAAEAALAARRSALVAGATVYPANGAKNIALDSPIIVIAKRGHLMSVKATGPGGFPYAGQYTPDGTRWLTYQALAPGSTYHVAVTVTDASGVQGSTATSFSTLTPGTTVGASLFPTDGMRPGIAQPVVVKFDAPINDSNARASVLRHLTVTESRPVEGGWHWFSSTELHFRPHKYWPVGEQVTVKSDLNGWNAGDGRWGTGAHHVQFTIGDAHVSVANLATDSMTVSDNGKVIAVIPISGGRPSLPTMNGNHIVLDRESVVRMISTVPGDSYNELVYNDVHISDSGEYVHAAPWSVGSQGHTNVSHGCINISPANAAMFMNFSRLGDVVQVVGGPRPPVPGDHGVMDWDTDWSQWTPVAPVFPVTPPPFATAVPRR